MASNRCLCEECRAVFHADEVLHAESPFDASQIYACPRCKEVNHIIVACERDGCDKPATCGSPTKYGGYAHTCYEHRNPEDWK